MERELTFTVDGVTFAYRYRDCPNRQIEHSDFQRAVREIRQGFMTGELTALMSPGGWWKV